MKKLFITVIPAFFFGTLWAHPYHVSITDISLNPETGNLEITLRLFLDDINHYFERIETKKLNIGDKNEKQKAEDELKHYVLNAFSIKQTTDLNISFLGKEVEDDLLWIYMEAADFEKNQGLTIKNDILTQLLPDQTNRINLSIDGKIKSTILNKENTEYEFQLD